MINKSVYTFIATLCAGLKGNKSFIVAKATKGNLLAAAVFKRLRIIKKVSRPNRFFMRSKQKSYINQYLIFWIHNLTEAPATIIGNRTYHYKKWEHFSRQSKSYKISIVGTPSTYYRNFMSYHELKNIKPYHNTIWIMQTPFGIITSREAIRHRVGGFVICRIDLL